MANSNIFEWTDSTVEALLNLVSEKKCDTPMRSRDFVEGFKKYGTECCPDTIIYYEHTGDNETFNNAVDKAVGLIMKRKIKTIKGHIQAYEWAGVPVFKSYEEIEREAKSKFSIIACPIYL